MNKPAYPHPVIAREGWPYLATMVLISVLCTFWSPWGSLPLWLITLFVLQFFRDPARVAPDGELNVLSPADEEELLRQESAAVGPTGIK